MDVQLLTRVKDCVIVPYVEYNRWDGVHWITLTTITFSIDDKVYEIPPGFYTDMGSIPRLFRATIDRMGKSLIAFVIHDYLYGEFSPFTRKQADKIMYEIGRYCGESWYTSNKIFNPGDETALTISIQ